jgi:hypothetical protein
MSRNPSEGPSSPLGRDRRGRRPDDSPASATGPSGASPRAKSTGPAPSGWGLSDARPRYKRQLSNTAEKKADQFEQYIREGYSPGDAASLLGPGSMLKPLRSAPGQYEIRLNNHDRLTFMSDDATKTITILEIGGHT